MTPEAFGYYWARVEGGEQWEPVYWPPADYYGRLVPPTADSADVIGCEYKRKVTEWGMRIYLPTEHR